MDVVGGVCDERAPVPNVEAAVVSQYQYWTCVLALRRDGLVCDASWQDKLTGTNVLLDWPQQVGM